MGDPADSVMQETKQIAVPCEPARAFDVAGEPRRAAPAGFAQRDRWLVCAIVTGRRVPADSAQIPAPR